VSWFDAGENTLVTIAAVSPPSPTATAGVTVELASGERRNTTIEALTWDAGCILGKVIASARVECVYKADQSFYALARKRGRSDASLCRGSMVVYYNKQTKKIERLYMHTEEELAYVISLIASGKLLLLNSCSVLHFAVSRFPDLTAEGKVCETLKNVFGCAEGVALALRANELEDPDVWLGTIQIDSTLVVEDAGYCKTHGCLPLDTEAYENRRDLLGSSSFRGCRVLISSKAVAKNYAATCYHRLQVVRSLPNITASLLADAELEVAVGPDHEQTVTVTMTKHPCIPRDPRGWSSLALSYYIIWGGTLSKLQTSGVLMGVCDDFLNNATPELILATRHDVAMVSSLLHTELARAFDDAGVDPESGDPATAIAELLPLLIMHLSSAATPERMNEMALKQGGAANSIQAWLLWKPVPVGLTVSDVRFCGSEYWYPPLESILDRAVQGGLKSFGEAVRRTLATHRESQSTLPADEVTAVIKAAARYLAVAGNAQGACSCCKTPAKHVRGCGTSHACTRAAGGRQCLKRHEKKKQTEKCKVTRQKVENYPCEHCGGKFTRFSNLRRHQVSCRVLHPEKRKKKNPEKPKKKNPEKPKKKPKKKKVENYPCEHCDRQYSLVSSLRFHQKKCTLASTADMREWLASR